MDRILELYELLKPEAAAIAHIIRVRVGISIDNNHLHGILLEYEDVRTPAPARLQTALDMVGRVITLMSVHTDWFGNSREQWCLAVEDDVSGSSSI